jgi:hypothetical protein
MSSLKGLVDGGKQYMSVSYHPHRSVWSTSVDGSGDQQQNEELSGKSYSDRMSSIKFNFKVNGKTFEKSDMTLLPGGNFRIDNPGLKKSGTGTAS